MKRTIKKQFWFSRDEAQDLQKKAKKTCLSEAALVRLLLRGYEPKEKPDDRFYDAMREFSAIGNNIHQISVKANALGFIDAESANEFDDFIAKSKELSFYDTGVTAEYGDKLITLSTCEYSRNNSRLVVVAKRITEDGGADAAKTHAEATAEGERPN